jgi:HK97 family phage portal protein
MAYLDELIAQTQITMQQQQQNTDRLMGNTQFPYASYYPSWEVQTPQYITPTPYSLAQVGYRTNELAYTCINERAARVSEAPLMHYSVDEEGEFEEVPKSNLRKLLKNPCVRMSEKEFLKIIQIYTLIAGYSVWEKERNNLGEVIHLWPMRPDWCSFLRGQQQPIRAVRYQPWGLPFADIPVEDTVIFQYFDPIFPQLKGLSPTAVALEIVNSDNNMTNMVNQFMLNGAFLGGVLKTEQVLADAEADRIKARWKQQHAGSKNAGDIAVFGKGVEFSKTNQTFREMVFPEVDARAEARICMIYRISPITIAAKVGIGVATYNNYKEARAANYESVTMDDWNFIAGNIETQLLPDFVGEGELENQTVQFDTSKVKALQEDQTARVDRADKMYKGGWAKLNEARAEAQLDPEDGEEGDQYYKAPSPIGVPKLDKDGNPMENIPPKGQTPEQLKPFAEATREKTQVQQDLETEEEKNFRAFAKRRIKEHKAADIPEFEFKYVPEERALALVAQYAVIDNGASKVLEGIKSAMETLGKQPPAPTIPQPINIQVHSYPSEPPTVNIENKSSDVTMPAPNVTVVNKVEPTPVQVTNRVEQAQAKPKKAKLTKDGNGNITIEEA